MKKVSHILKYLLLFAALFASLLAIFLAKWYTDRYGDTGFMSIISTFLTPWKGCSNNLSISWKLNALLPAGIITLIAFPLFFYRGEKFSLRIKEKRFFPIPRRISNIAFSLICAGLVIAAAFMVRFPAFVSDYYFNDTKLYDEYYIDPSEVNITFPETKRNLIYIYLESMETSFLSEELGGAEQKNLIPELYELAKENVNFSHNDGVGGWPRITHTTWTSAAMVSHTSGLPLTMDLSSIKIGEFEGYLPGATNLQDVLHEAGYYQTLMVGSDATFGAREEYYNLHHADHIYDLEDAKADGTLPEDYMVWWGFEDSKLFDYAKKEVERLAKLSQPFAFTMLTADTHHIDGYFGECCENRHEEQYQNVISCSSRQVMAFVEWIKQQPFYENTTVIICGDHLSMDNQYFVRNIDEDYERHVYNCFIHSAAETTNMKNRVFTPMDMFPSTLAALGCTIEGDRLGIGTNLFSDRQTLAEELGLSYLNDQISKHSDYYVKYFIKDIAK